MQTEKFSISEAIRFGWQTTKKNLGFFIGLLLVLFVVSAIFQNLAKAFENQVAILLIINLASWLVQSILTLGVLRITLKFCDGQKPKFSELFACASLILKYLVSSILFGLIVLGGLIFLIVPGIIVAIKYQFYSYLIVDKNLGPIAALKQSAKITQGSKWLLFRLGINFIGIVMVGILALLIGLFWAFPTVMLATAFVYRKLLNQTS